MPEGIQVELDSGFARVEFLNKAKVGQTLAQLLAVGGPGLIDVDTSGTRKTYIVPESIAEQAGLIESSAAETTQKRTARRPKAGTTTE